MQTFLQRHAAAIRGVLQGFDRVRLRGTIQRWAYAAGMAGFLAYRNILIKDFGQFADRTTQAIRRAADGRGQQAGRPLIYLQRSSEDKERLVQHQLQRHGVGKDGLVAMLGCIEPCWSFDIYRDRQHQTMELQRRWRKCLHYYFYLQDSMFGLIHVRLQTWFPFDVRICLNGREWLSRQLDAAKIGYQRRDNCLTWVEDFARAQKCFDHQLRIDWVKHADRLLRRASPDLADLLAGWQLQHYWSIEQSEWATDVVFKTPQHLAALYPRFIRHGLETFASPDVMRFLGQKLSAEGKVPARFAGEVVSDLRDRPEGVRLKHRLHRNSIKMYDKQGVVLRVETTINKAGDLKSYRPKAGDPDGPKRWLPLRQGVGDVRRRAELSQAANRRYLEALSAVEGSQPLSSVADRLCQPLKDQQGRARARALNPLSPDDARLLAAVNRGEFTISGFRNRDIRRALFGADPFDATLRRRQAGQVTRKLALLRAHGLIKRIPRTHRYLLTKKGLVAIPAFLAVRKANITTLVSAA